MGQMTKAEIIEQGREAYRAQINTGSNPETALTSALEAVRTAEKAASLAQVESWRPLADTYDRDGGVWLLKRIIEDLADRP
jgi:hypothetical protein